MKNIGQKIKDVAAAVTPGTHKHGEETRAETGLGHGYETGTTGTTGATEYGTTGTAGYGTTSGVGERGAAGYGTTTAGATYDTTGQYPRESTGTERMTQEAAAAEAAATGRPAVAQTVTTAAAAPTVAQGQAAVCGQEFFTKTEDRPVVTERVEYIKEHRPVEKEFVVETRATGVERELVEGRVVEHLGTTERIVSEAVPKGPCE